ncbi:hypothetical protein [Chromatium okenii]|nr:hypothetical protein [Chromatium okenii]
MQIQAFTHVPFEDPAAIADWAAQRGHTLNLTPFYTAQQFQNYQRLIGW